MRLFFKRVDGGADSNVMGYWLIEWKSLFSIALLRFSEGSRENFHNHAFHSISWVLYGWIVEERFNKDNMLCSYENFFPSFKPVITTRDNMHRVHGKTPSTWVLTFRGPWSKTWKERTPEGQQITLTHGREQVT